MKRVVVVVVAIALIAFGLAQSAFAMDPPQDTLNQQLLALLGSDHKNFNSDFLATEVKKVLDAGADPNAQAEFATALQLAAAWGHEPVCKLLLAYGADVNGKSSVGLTALMQATSHFNICKLLIDSGADVHVQTQSGYDALHYAVQALNTSIYNFTAPKKAKVCILLLEHGAELTKEKGPWQESALIAAAHYDGGSKYICKEIIAYRKRINAAIITTLRCLNRWRNDPEKDLKIRMCTNELYRQFKALLNPYMGTYIPLAYLLNQRNCIGKRAYDYLPIDCLNPNKINEPQSDLRSNCSIQ